MAFKIKRRKDKASQKEKPDKNQKTDKTQSPLQMITVVFGDPNKPCDCPICRELGIDLTQIDGTDVREITPEQSQRLIDMGALRPIEELIDWAGDEDLGDWERTVN